MPYTSSCKGCVFIKANGRCIAPSDLMQKERCLVFERGIPKSYIFKKIPTKIKVL